VDAHVAVGVATVVNLGLMASRIGAALSTATVPAAAMKLRRLTSTAPATGGPGRRRLHLGTLITRVVSRSAVPLILLRVSLKSL
jgi:hypothetical protein